MWIEKIGEDMPKRRTVKKQFVLTQEDKVMLSNMLTTHAKKRMAQRGVTYLDILCALDYGTAYPSGQCWRLVIGNNEIAQCRYDIRAHKGVHIVISSKTILTTYKNRNNQKRKRLRKYKYRAEWDRQYTH